MTADLEVIRAPRDGPCWNCRRKVPRGGNLWRYRPYGRVWVCTGCVALVIVAVLQSRRGPVSRDGPQLSPSADPAQNGAPPGP